MLFPLKLPHKLSTAAPVAHPVSAHAQGQLHSAAASLSKQGLRGKRHVRVSALPRRDDVGAQVHDVHERAETPTTVNSQVHKEGQRHEDMDENPWTFQNIVSMVSGMVGTMLTLAAHNKQREAHKARQTNGSSDKLMHDDGSKGQPQKSVRIVQQLGGSLLDAEAESPLFSLGPVPKCTDASDLRSPGRHFTIITTAALPWLTGTSVNPLLRALSLAQKKKRVVMVLPWLGADDQEFIFRNGTIFATPEEQERDILRWCKERAKVDASALPLRFRWYKAKYHKPLGCIFPTSDVSRELSDEDPRDVLILEEPEHLCWYHHGQRWPTLFRHVIGIVHTNYQDYIFQHLGQSQRTLQGQAVTNSAELLPSELLEFSVFASSAMVCSAYVDVNIKLSDTIMPLPNEVTCNVHGVRQEFLDIGDHMSSKSWLKRWKAKSGTDEDQSEDTPVYYLGKAVKMKGWGELSDLIERAGSQLEGIRIHGYGSGPDSELIKNFFEKLPETSAKVILRPGMDHASEALHSYGVLVNPSTTDVLCTVTVEALAMGKHCVLAKHVSNRFFEENFPDRCHFFLPGDATGFAQALKKAIEVGRPQPLPPDQRHILTWEAATERLFTAAEVRVLSGPFQRPSDASVSRLAYRLHFDLMHEDGVLADVIKEATLGEATPWDEYFSEWRSTQMNRLREQFAGKPLRAPEHIQEHEEYLRNRISELSKLISP